jgi:hypothetical protein
MGEDTWGIHCHEGGRQPDDTGLWMGEDTWGFHCHEGGHQPDKTG